MPVPVEGGAAIKLHFLEGLWLIAIALSMFVFFYFQLLVISRVLRPTEKEDDRQVGPLRIMGQAKGERLHSFLNDAEYSDLRKKWGLSLFCMICLFVPFLLWMGIFRKLVF